MSVHVFNRRRAGEIERALIEDFQNLEKLNENMYSDIYKSLSAQHKEIAQKYVRFCIRGKKDAQCLCYCRINFLKVSI